MSAKQVEGLLNPALPSVSGLAWCLTPQSLPSGMKEEAQRGQGPLLPGLISGRRKEARWLAGVKGGRSLGKFSVFWKILGEQKADRS